jgi:hypothetical protein
MAINNSIFKDDQEIGRVVSKWMNIYNKNQSSAITNILQENVPLYLHICQVRKITINNLKEFVGFF